ncbi:proline-rich receptor-like protein kinase PERK10 [Coffea eugenioides]|uniref:proline-rich receptor-like protein kinase PERK10 n=1 Tax=Coffea eugenioides TaxID=49369 RepID=UPI000F608F28|nr:proline-rich receptor-like protein kinase PERK10 [Coffea eugenioides]
MKLIGFSMRSQKHYAYPSLAGQRPAKPHHIAPPDTLEPTPHGTDVTPQESHSIPLGSPRTACVPKKLSLPDAERRKTSPPQSSPPDLGEPQNDYPRRAPLPPPPREEPDGPSNREKEAQPANAPHPPLLPGHPSVSQEAPPSAS